MAWKFFDWTKAVFALCCVVGLFGFTFKTEADADLPTLSEKCIYNSTTDFTCTAKGSPSNDCTCTYFNCSSEKGDFSATKCICEIGNATVQVHCNQSVCMISADENTEMPCNISGPVSNSSDYDEEAQTCLEVPCEQWSEWVNCSKQCGGGSRQRSRNCPSFEKGACLQKLATDQSVCNTEPCPTWSDWADWSSCSSTCDNGVPGFRTRTRACPKPNSCGNGSAFETDPCTSNVTCPTWSEWGPWGTCSRTCNRGDRSRHRQCNFSTPIDTCLGSGEQMEPCFETACPFGAEWSPWSPCTASCGGGMKTRSKISCAQGPPTCPSQSDQAKCNEQACPQWSNWEPWLECSKTCGGGQRVRKRVCPIYHGCVGRTMNLDRLRCNNFECPTTIAPPVTTTTNRSSEN